MNRQISWGAGQLLLTRRPWVYFKRLTLTEATFLCKICRGTMSIANGKGANAKRSSNKLRIFTKNKLGKNPIQI